VVGRSESPVQDFPYEAVRAGDYSKGCCDAQDWAKESGVGYVPGVGVDQGSDHGTHERKGAVRDESLAMSSLAEASIWARFLV
jgi:hypothetical protein